MNWFFNHIFRGEVPYGAVPHGDIPQGGIPYSTSGSEVLYDYLTVDDPAVPLIDESGNHLTV